MKYYRDDDGILWRFDGFEYSYKRDDTEPSKKYIEGQDIYIIPYDFWIRAFPPSRLNEIKP